MHVVNTVGFNWIKISRLSLKFTFWSLRFLIVMVSV